MKDKRIDPEAELLRRLVIQRGFDALARAPLAPLSARGKAMLVETMHRFGVSDTSAIEALPAHRSALAQWLFGGATGPVRLAAEQVRGWIAPLLDPSEYVVRAPAPSLRREGAANTGSAAAPLTGWTLVRINAEAESSTIELVLATDVPDPWPRDVCVLAWTSAALERVRSAAGDVVIESGDVVQLFEGAIERDTLTIDLPVWFQLMKHAAPARLPVDEHGVLQILLEIAPLR